MYDNLFGCVLRKSLQFSKRVAYGFVHYAALFPSFYAARKYLNPFKSYRQRNTSIISLMLKTYNGKYMGDVLASKTRNVCATRMQFGPLV